jgi:hypothetical protein
MHDAVNAAVIESIENGIASSCSLMVPCPAAANAMRLLRQRPHIPFGIHLALIRDSPRYRWGPAAAKADVASLLDADTNELYLKTPAQRTALLAAAKLTDVERGDHVEVLARVAGSPRRAVREAFDAEVERSYVGYAIDNEFEDFVDSLRIWQDWVDQDGAEDQADSDHEARHLHLSETFRGNWVLNGQLDPVVGAEVAEALRRIDRELFEADWAEAKAVHGEDTRLEHLARTPAQRHADALGEMARRASTAPKDGKRPRPLFVAHLGADSLNRLCETATGTPITPGQLVPLITQADIERIVYAGESREILDLGAKTRLFTGALRRAIQLRDRQCVEPGCRIPADQCDVDPTPPAPWVASPTSTTASAAAAPATATNPEPTAANPAPATTNRHPSTPANQDCPWWPVIWSRWIIGELAQPEAIEVGRSGPRQ